MTGSARPGAPVWVAAAAATPANQRGPPAHVAGSAGAGTPAVPQAMPALGLSCPPGEVPAWLVVKALTQQLRPTSEAALLLWLERVPLRQWWDKGVLRRRPFGICALASCSFGGREGRGLR